MCNHIWIKKSCKHFKIRPVKISINRYFSNPALRIYFVRRTNNFCLWILHNFKWHLCTETFRTMYKINPLTRCLIRHHLSNWTHSLFFNWMKLFYFIFLIPRSYDSTVSKHGPEKSRLGLLKFKGIQFIYPI